MAGFPPGRLEEQMGLRIEDYAVIGDLHTAALVGRNGSIDWLCVPRLDSGAVFAALLGSEENGHWQLAPTDSSGVRSVRRRYRGETLVLETEFETDTGLVRLVDAMPPRVDQPKIIRLVEGVRGRVGMSMQLRLRFDYGSVVPWVRRLPDALMAVAGPDAMTLRTPVRTHGRGMSTLADFEVSAGQVVPFVLSWHPSHLPPPDPIDPLATVDETEAWWAEWIAGCSYTGEWQDAVRRSLVTLKALTYQPTGGIAAALTTSLPEQLGGVRNWDYRYCWLRDATFTLLALVYAGFDDEARAWREWLLRAIAGDPARLQIMYGVAGERRLAEFEVPWLAGYERSAPVRVGNAAVDQFQLDVYGEVMDAMHVARTVGMHGTADGPDTSWSLQRKLMEFLEGHWAEPDEGIWEVRGPRRDFVHSKVMAWVAVDRAVRGITECGLPGPEKRWAALRDKIHAEVLEHGFDSARSTFTQYYGSKELDAALLLVPVVGFLPAADPRVAGTVAAIEKELCHGGFVRRYSTAPGGSVDGLPPGEGAFLACTFWLADNYALLGQRKKARETFERLLDLRNDVGLLSEEYDLSDRRMVGNFPQAFSHVHW
ncbi:MAG: glycoside hydrolase family 15 protein [Mycobacteriales bacterium]